jgi:hypothetical protein
MWATHHLMQPSNHAASTCWQALVAALLTARTWRPAWPRKGRGLSSAVGAPPPCCPAAEQLVGAERLALVLAGSSRRTTDRVRPSTTCTKRQWFQPTQLGTSGGTGLEKEMPKTDNTHQCKSHTQAHGTWLHRRLTGRNDREARQGRPTASRGGRRPAACMPRDGSTEQGAAGQAAAGSQPRACKCLSCIHVRPTLQHRPRQAAAERRRLPHACPGLPGPQQQAAASRLCGAPPGRGARAVLGIESSTQ